MHSWNLVNIILIMNLLKEKEKGPFIHCKKFLNEYNESISQYTDCFASGGRVPRAVREPPRSHSSLRGLTWTRYSRRSRHLPLHRTIRKYPLFAFLYLRGNHEIDNTINKTNVRK